MTFFITYDWEKVLTEAIEDALATEVRASNETEAIDIRTVLVVAAFCDNLPLDLDLRSTRDDELAAGIDTPRIDRFRNLVRVCLVMWKLSAEKDRASLVSAIGLVLEMLDWRKEVRR